MYDFYGSLYSSSTGITANVVLSDLDLTFQGQTFQVVNLTKKCKHYHCDQEVRYLPANGSTAIVVQHDFDLQLQGHQIWNVKIWKTVKASEKCSNWLHGGWNLPSNGTIAVGVLRGIDLRFQRQTFSCYAFAIKRLCIPVQAADVPGRFVWLVRLRRGVALVTGVARGVVQLVHVHPPGSRQPNKEKTAKRDVTPFIELLLWRHVRISK